MISGMLWWDNSTSTLEMKIKKAADYYLKKYGRQPDLCLVHPSLIDKSQPDVKMEGMTIRPYRQVLPGHIWLGIEDAPK